MRIFEFTLLNLPQLNLTANKAKNGVPISTSTPRSRVLLVDEPNKLKEQPQLLDLRNEP